MVPPHSDEHFFPVLCCPEKWNHRLDWDVCPLKSYKGSAANHARILELINLNTGSSVAREQTFLRLW